MHADPGKQAELERRIALLREGFVAQLPVRLEAMQTEWQGYASSGARARLVDLHRLAHSLTGTAGTFGLMALSQAARDLEQRLKPLAAGDREVDAAAREDIKIELAALAAVLPASAAEPVSPADPVAVSTGGAAAPVLLLSQDAALQETLAAQLGYFGYRLRGAATPEQLLGLEATPPATCVIIDLECCAQALWGGDVMARIQAVQGEAVPIVVVAPRDSLQERIQAVRSGAQAFLVKPFDVPDLVDQLDLLTGGQEADPYRILIVEDDPLLAERYTLLLQNEGMQVSCVNHPLDIMPVLVDLQPDLVLMDLYMPDCSGTELARVIRQQEAYISLPIVFLSSETDLDKQFEAMSLGGDDFLAKPITDRHLVKAVGNRAARSRKLHSLMARDSLTGLLKHTKITEALEVELTRAKRQGIALSYAMLDIDHFKQINDRYGHLAGDHILKSLAYLLRQRLRKTDIIGRYGGEEFAIVMPATEVAVAARVIDAVREGFANILHHWNEVEIRCSFSAGVAGSDTHSESMDLTAAADRALYLAKEAGRNQVRVA